MMTSWEPVVDYLQENMQKQTYKKDERLPSEHELAQRFELTRIEVRKAYDRLKEMGYVGVPGTVGSILNSYQRSGGYGTVGLRVPAIFTTVLLFEIIITLYKQKSIVND